MENLGILEPPVIKIPPGGGEEVGSMLKKEIENIKPLELAFEDVMRTAERIEAKLKK